LRDWLPVGEGVVTFSDLAEAANGVERINADYPRHRHAARRIADQFFATDQVLPRFLKDALS
jgi:hypothetical protein